MADIEKVYNKMMTETYYDRKELLYGANANIFLSQSDYEKLLDYKQNLTDSKFVYQLPLKSWINGPLFYSHAKEIMDLRSTLFSLINEDYEETKSLLSLRNADEITKSRIYSEIEGSLSIENVPTTRIKVKGLINGTIEPSDLNDVIIKNMGKGIEFVSQKPEFNKENLKKLYDILSDGCLSDEYKLHDGDYYRYDGVEIAQYEGASVNQIDECMNSLFDYVNENLTNKDMLYVLPHIAHYYLVYIHPYFDYNGRTSRMVSLWIHILMGSQFIPSGVSEAINQTRNKYYAALSETRDSKNDLTYFLKYIYRMSIDYILAYKNIEYITQNFANKGIDWSETEKAYFKKILISYSGKFSFETFKKIANLDISKVGLLKILNKFEEYGLLTGSRAKSKAKFFEINKDMLKYLPDNLRNVS